MEKDSLFHVLIKPEKGTKLKYKKPQAEGGASNTLPAHIGTIFKSKEEIREEVVRKTFKDFFN